MNYEANLKLFVFSKSILSRMKFVLLDYNTIMVTKDPFLVMVAGMFDEHDPCQRKRKVDNLVCLECIITFIKVSIPRTYQYDTLKAPLCHKVYQMKVRIVKLFSIINNKVLFPLIQQPL